MKLKATFLLLFFVQIVLAQFGPEMIISTCEICTPEDAFAADMDNDGDNDILVASSIDNKISWFENLGDGTFNGPLVISNDVPKASAVLAADFDGDGHLDIAVSAINERRVGILYSDGAGSFSEPDYMSYLSIRVESFVAGDLDNDGDMDLICAEMSAASWFENTGNGGFIRRTVDQLTTIQAVQVADMDGDNDLDVLVSSNQDMKIAWYENNGTGGFSDPKLVADVGNYVFSIATGDLDNDGDLDVLGKGFFSDYLAWYPNDGSGNFGEGVYVSSSSDRGISTSIADIDGDGDLDVISSSTHYSGQIIYYPNDGTGGFPDQLTIDYQLPGVESILTIDIDNDGILDIVAAAQQYDQIAWYENENNLNFSEHILSFNPNHFITKIVAADIDQDGFQDCLVMPGSDHHLYWYLNNGTEQFVRQDNIPTSEKNNSVNIGLLNEDIYPDILVCNANGINLITNNGAGDFMDETVIYSSTSDISRNATIGDLNSDNKIDILTCSQYFNNIAWLQNTGTGGFSDPIIISSDIEEPRNILAVDLDGDGYLDVISSTDPGQLVWFENMGDDTFSGINEIDASLAWSTTFNAADLDSDGDQDIMAISNEYVLWYQNAGDGTFSERKIIYEHTTGLHAQGIFGIDIDGDGDKDVVTGAYSSISEQDNTTGIVYWENLGDGNFSEKRNIGVADHYNYIYPSDINSDGDYDLFVSSRDNEQISWYENLSDYPTISGFVFYDENDNGILDGSEQALQNTPINLTPDALSSYTDANGGFRFYVDDGTYILTTSPDDCWVLTSDSSSYTVEIDNSSFSDLNFGYNLSFQNPHVQPRLYSGFTRCGFEVGFNLKVENDGCTIANGLFGLVLDDLVTYIDASVAPDIINGDTLWWNYSDLFPTEFASINLTFEIAGVDFIGDYINMEVLSLIETEDAELVPSGSYSYQSIIQCAYDPNDKNVYPNRLDQYQENYTLFEEFLEYTIRFQNTGTDTAFTVVIRDTLDENLDLSTFRPITGSHPFETFLSENGFLAFHFKDILLPDSTTNEIGSHGYVSFKIKAKPNLEEHTEVSNSASIFFDFNPPILTNTVENVLVSQLPVIGNSSEENRESTFSIFPNPTTGIVTFSSKLTEDYQLNLLALSGQVIRSYELSKREAFTFDVSDIPAGLYLVAVQNDNIFWCQKIIILR